MRELSPLTRYQMSQEESSTPLFAFLVLDLGANGFLRVVNNWEPVTRNGEEYVPYYFEVTLPNESGEAEIPEVSLKIDNIDQVILAAIQEVDGQIPVELSVALSLTPNVDEAGPFSFTITQVDWDENSITASMTYETLLVRSFPYKRFVPSDYPGAF